MAGDPDWRSTPTGAGLADAINALIAQGRIGGTVGTLSPPVDPLDWRNATNRVGDKLCDEINALIALGKLSTFPASITVGAPVGTPDWLSTARRSGSALADYINMAILTGRIVGLGPVPPTGTLNYWYSADNIDLTGNSSLVDGQTIGTWKNRGSVGATGDLVQATGGIRPIYRAVATAAKLNNKPGVEATGTQWMSTALADALVQPLVIALLVRSDTAAAVEFMADGRVGGGTARNTLLAQSGTAQFASNSIVNMGTIVAGQYSAWVATFNGASSQGRINSVAGAVVNPGAFALDGVSLFTSNAPSGMLDGMIIEYLCYSSGVLPADIEAYFIAKYGVTPQ
jgi:hypothetical protein